MKGKWVIGGKEPKDGWNSYSSFFSMVPDLTENIMSPPDQQDLWVAFCVADGYVPLVSQNAKVTMGEWTTFMNAVRGAAMDALQGPPGWAPQSSANSGGLEATIYRLSQDMKKWTQAGAASPQNAKNASQHAERTAYEAATRVKQDVSAWGFAINAWPCMGQTGDISSCFNYFSGQSKSAGIPILFFITGDSGGYRAEYSPLQQETWFVGFYNGCYYPTCESLGAAAKMAIPSI